MVARLWVVLIGLVLPFSWLVLISKKQRGKNPGSVPIRIPAGIWILLGLTALFLRLFRLTQLSSWPIVDEGIFAYFATLLEEKWNWQLVHCFAQEPILYTWGQFLVFKLFGNSLASLWLFPAICSILCVPAAWLAGRRALGPAAGIFAAGWMAFGFWPLYMGRFSVQSILMVFWECMVFFALALLLSSENEKKENKALFGLVLLAGTGFYVYLAWPMVALLTGGAVLLNPAQTWSKRLKLFALYFSGTLLISLPLGLVFTKDYRGYFDHLWAAHSMIDWETRFQLPLGYLKELFWGGDLNAFSYGPLWGGLFNPILTTLFFVGLAFLLRSWGKPLNRWILAALAFFSLPAFLTNNLEMMRLTALLPVLIAVAAIGTQEFICFFKPTRKLLLFSLLVAASISLDVYHLFRVFPAVQINHPAFYGAHKTPEFEKAYALLKTKEVQEGPGLIFLNFHPDPYDQTLFAATYSFNAAENSHLDSNEAKWAALLTNIHEQPFLKKAFPDCSWSWLSEGLNRPDGGWLLALIPVNRMNRGLLGRWTKADESFAELTRQVMELGVDPDQKAMLCLLDQAYPLFKGDPLLESRYWRIRAIHETAAGHLKQAIEDENKAISLGHPMAHLYNELGCLLFKEDRPVESKKAFEEALRLKPNCTNAFFNLENLSK